MKQQVQVYLLSSEKQSCDIVIPQYESISTMTFRTALDLIGNPKKWELSFCHEQSPNKEWESVLKEQESYVFRV